MTITPRQATIAALTTITIMGLGSSIARADPTLTATSTVGADGSVSFESVWNCVSPYRTCSYGWRWLNGTRLGVNALVRQRDGYAREAERLRRALEVIAHPGLTPRAEPWSRDVARCALANEPHEALSSVPVEDSP